MKGGGFAAGLLTAAWLAACGSPGRVEGPVKPLRVQRGAASVLVVVDSSDAMAGDALVRARAALERLVRALPARDRVGMARFGEQFEPLVPVKPVRANRRPLIRALSELEAEGDSAVYDATLQAYGIQRELAGGARRNTVLVLARGEDSESHSSFERVRRLLSSQAGTARVRVFTIAYDTEPDAGLPQALRAFARASGGRAYSAGEAQLAAVLRRIWQAL